MKVLSLPLLPRTAALLALWTIQVAARTAGNVPVDGFFSTASAEIKESNWVRDLSMNFDDPQYDKFMEEKNKTKPHRRKRYHYYTGKGTGKGAGKGYHMPKEVIENLVIPFIQPPCNDCVTNDEENIDESKDQVGAKFLWSANFFTGADEEEPGILGNVTGSCVRLRLADDSDGLPSVGSCSFTYTDIDGNAIEAFGDLVDNTTAYLAITGGTKRFQSAYGQVEITPFYSNPDNGVDVFTDVFLYDGTLDIKFNDPTLGNGDDNGFDVIPIEENA